MTENETAGTVLGGVAGAVVGNQLGNGSGKTVATALGAIIGATAGCNIGKSLDETSQARAGAATEHALRTAAVGEKISWENPDNARGPARGSAKVTRQGTNSEGRTCRDDNRDWKLAT